MTDLLRRTARRIRARVPGMPPFIVRRVPAGGTLKDNAGDCGPVRHPRTRRVLYWRLRILNTQSPGEQFDCLLHEAAHALHRSRERARWPLREWHSNGWGIAFAQIFRAIHPTPGLKRAAKRKSPSGA